MKPCIGLAALCIAGAAVTACRKAKNVDDFAGVYELTSDLENTTCVEGGEPTKEKAAKYFVVRTGLPDELKMGILATAVSCTDTEECLRMAKDWNLPFKGFQFNFSAQANGELSGVYYSSGFPRDGVCRGTFSDKVRLTADGDGVRIEDRGGHAEMPPNADGLCRSGDAERANAGKPCNYLRTIKGKRIPAS
jgi:hypothetical protein